MYFFWSFENCIVMSIIIIIVLLIIFSTVCEAKRKRNTTNTVKLKSKYNWSLFKRFLVKEHEKAIFYKEDNFIKILSPGIYWMFDFLNRLKVENCDLRNPLLANNTFLIILKQHPELMEQNFTLIDLSDNEVGLLYEDNKLKEVIPPSTRRAYWKGVVDVKVEVLNIETNKELPKDKLDLIIHLPGTFEKIVLEDIKEHEVGLLLVNSIFIKLLEPGIYAFWKFNKFIEIKHIDKSLQMTEISGQEIMTSDKVTLRINLSANYLIKDPIKLLKHLTKYNDYLYKELQFAIREAVGVNTLDELLSKKDEINQIIFNSAVTKLAEYGIELQNVGIKDIILPGDMRDILNQVVEAEKQAQANLIKRREETAATRSLLNTAKLMEDNPTLLRLKELEILEKVSAKINSLNVYGGFDGILKELVKLKTN